MFVRKNKNRSGSISVQIISKENGGYKVIETIGSGRTREEITELCLEAQTRLHQRQFPNQASLFLYPDEIIVRSFIEGLSNRQIQTVGPELVFGFLFDCIGFNAIKDDLFRHLVIARLAYPTSKLKTVDYLKRYKNISLSPSSLYRFLDKLHSRYQGRVEEIAFRHTKKKLKGNIAIVFYDMTSLYFEAEDEDDLRRIGFSKDGKFHKPQIMLGLLVGERGLPISYNIFQGNAFEGHTLLPTLKRIGQRYAFKKPIVVADAALLSKDNLTGLTQEGYQFIVGARIKNETAQLKQNILIKARAMKDGDSSIIKKQGKTRLIITYSDKRAKQDQYHRERGLKKLKEKINNGKLTKEHINNRGYVKFLTLIGETTIKLNEAKISEDKKWDGLKGYITNTRLSAKKVAENYGHLWQIERAFRISKTDLRIRPIYHFQKKRIEAHICIAFASYAIYKELEGLLIKHKINISPRRAAELTHNMYGIELTLPKSHKKELVILKMDREQELLLSTIKKHPTS